MEIYARDIKNIWLNYKLWSRIDLNFTLSLPLTPTDQCWSFCVCDVVPQSQHWQVGEGEGRKYSDIFNVNFYFSCRTTMF